MTNFSDSHVFPGLSEVEATRLLKVHGYNELPSQKKPSLLSILIRVLSEPMLLLLIGCGILYFLIGETKDAAMLVAFVFVMIGITFFQERKTERTLEALRELSSPRALVIRDGKQIRIPGREVVRKDLIVIREGDRIPADATVLTSENLMVDESLLTGESIPVRKSDWDYKLSQQKPGGDNLPFVYSGSLVVSGWGEAIVTSTGVHTAMGKIGKSLGLIKEEETLLRKETAKIVRGVTVIGIILCTITILAYYLLKDNLIQGILAGLTLSMAMLPEEFPVVLLVFQTLGAWRISKNKVLTRRVAAIETLGSATILCSDKTGTLTQNKMELGGFGVNDSFFFFDTSSPKTFPEKFHQLLEYAILASQSDPFDPIEKEIKRKGEKLLKDSKHLHTTWHLAKEYPLSKELLTISRVWQSPDNNEYVIASKGAPEAIIDICHLAKQEKERILNRVTAMSEKGQRVLGVAKATFSRKNLPSNQHDYKFEFVGLAGFYDPIRPTVPHSVREAHQAGIRVMMITGDYPGTAQFIARQIGLKNPDQYITGEDLDKMNSQELREKIKDVNIFARVVPEQKLLIVNALKDNGEVVAMTGDGVNDAPALKSANIGIAMGERGTDVAREAAHLVLLDDNFSSIVSAVREGRRIFNNLKQAMGYIMAVHVPIAGMTILPLLFDLPVVLMPAHIAFLELIIDPACSIVFESEKEDSDIMKRPPRSLHSPLFNLKNVSLNLLQGVGVLIATFLLFAYIIRSGRGELVARSFAFVSLVLSNILLIVVNLSWRKNISRIIFSSNKTLYLIISIVLVCLICVLYVPFLSSLFHLSALAFIDIVLIGAVVLISLSWFEGLKLIRNITLS